MQTALYSAATAMDAAAARHEVIASNLAHAQVPGFRRSDVSAGSFETSMQQAQSRGSSSAQLGVGKPEPHIDFSPGTVELTGRPLDVALDDDGFFAVEGPDGPLYTRNGSFRVNAEGTLVTTDGLPVRAVGGANITLPTGASVENVSISKSGNVSAGDVSLGQLETVRFADNSRLTPQGASLFAADGLDPETSTAIVLQGHRELSNVHPVDELVALITSMRHYESAQRAIRSVSDSIERRLQPN